MVTMCGGDKMKYRMLLARSASGKGGDRYESSNHPKEEKPWVVYVPQSISRRGQKVAVAIDITVEPDFEM